VGQKTKNKRNLVAITITSNNYLKQAHFFGLHFSVCLLFLIPLASLASSFKAAALIKPQRVAEPLMGCLVGGQ